MSSSLAKMLTKRRTWPLSSQMRSLMPGYCVSRLGDQRADGGAGRGDLFLALGELAERSRDSDGGHVESLL